MQKEKFALCILQFPLCIRDEVEGLGQCHC
jgi:hypothetical protein